MHFSSTSRNISLDLNGGRVWIAQRYPLHDVFHVARDSPRLRYNWSEYQGYALTDWDYFDRNSVTLIGGTIFKARVKATMGDWADAVICLDFFLSNELGMLVSEAP